MVIGSSLHLLVAGSHLALPSIVAPCHVALVTWHGGPSSSLFSAAGLVGEGFLIGPCCRSWASLSTRVGVSSWVVARYGWRWVQRAVSGMQCTKKW